MSADRENEHERLQMWADDQIVESDFLGQLRDDLSNTLCHLTLNSSAYKVSQEIDKMGIS